MLPRSAMSSLSPKYGEPAPAAPAVPNARDGRSICTVPTSAPFDSPPTIHAVEPATTAAAWDTGTCRCPAGSSRLLAGSKAQMVDTVAVAGDAAPVPAPPPVPPVVSWVVPRPGTRCWAAVLSPPATSTSPSTVTAAAPASGSGSSPMTAAVCRAGSTSWMARTGAPACGPVMAWPPNTKICPSSAATAGYRTGTPSAATTVNVRPSRVASTDASGRVPS